MGLFTFPSPPTTYISILNMILTQVQQSLESSHPLVVPGLDEHSSSLLLNSLKNEIDPPPLEPSLTLDLFIEPCFPLPSENVPISNHMPKRVKNQISK
jgi:hypothetical protein